MSLGNRQIDAKRREVNNSFLRLRDFEYAGENWECVPYRSGFAWECGEHLIQVRREDEALRFALTGPACAKEAGPCIYDSMYDAVLAAVQVFGYAAKKGCLP